MRRFLARPDMAENNFLRQSAAQPRLDSDQGTTREFGIRFQTIMKLAQISPAVFWFVVVWLLAPSPLAAAESPAQRDTRMQWFREARFGLFIHWGIYSLPAGEWNGKTNYGEWFLEETKMPVSQYEKFAPQFNPVKFDARQWVNLAKNAGMKYIVITT